MPSLFRRLFLRSLCAVAVVWLSPALAAAPSAVDAELQRAQASLNAGQYNEAMQQYQRIYRIHGHALAAFSIALFYRAGWARPVDAAQACDWFDKAVQAKPRLPAALQFYGDCLAEGVGRAADPAKAAEAYRQAGDAGDLIAYCSLGRLYVDGRGVERDPQKGLALCRRAAEQGSPPAMLQMAQLLLEGDGSGAERDPAAAYGWFQQAAQYGSAEAQYRLGVMNRDGIGHAVDAEAARGWFEAAAAQGYTAAIFPTAQLYFNAAPDAQSGGPSPEVLAKDYLWLRVATQCLSDPVQLGASREMLAQVLQIMPQSWAPSLDEKLKGHLCEAPAQRAVS